MTASSQDDFVDKLRRLTARLPKGEWILGGYWGAYDQWARGSAGRAGRQPFTPDMRLVEEITRDHPTFIRKFDDSEAGSPRLREQFGSTGSGHRFQRRVTARLE